MFIKLRKGQLPFSIWWLGQGVILFYLSLIPQDDYK